MPIAAIWSLIVGFRYWAYAAMAVSAFFYCRSYVVEYEWRGEQIDTLTTKVNVLTADNKVLLGQRKLDQQAIDTIGQRLALSAKSLDEQCKILSDAVQSTDPVGTVLDRLKEKNK